jgi:hypothetical protein
MTGYYYWEEQVPCLYSGRNITDMELDTFYDRQPTPLSRPVPMWASWTHISIS